MDPQIKPLSYLGGGAVSQLVPVPPPQEIVISGPVPTDLSCWNLYLHAVPGTRLAPADFSFFVHSWIRQNFFSSPANFNFKFKLKF